MNDTDTDTGHGHDAPTEPRTDMYFTFGQDHMTNFPLPRGGRIADYWVRVNLPKYALNHRELFIMLFTSYHCPSRMQFAMQYSEDSFEPEFFPNGELCLITEGGIQRNE